MNDFPQKLFITGTDSNVGKTLVSAILTLGLNAAYIKPIQCGVMPCTDTEWIHDLTKLDKNHFLEEIYRFPDSHDPNTQHTDIDIATLLQRELDTSFSHLIIESTGGLMVPIYGNYFQVDYLADLSIPTLLVVKNQKGAVNQAILSITKLREKNIPIFGIVLNGQKDPVVKESISQYCPGSRIFELDEIEHITKDALVDAFEKTFSSMLSAI